MNKALGLFYAACAFVFFFLYYYLSTRIGANSDNMSSLLISNDMAQGNITLEGWTMSTQSYFFSDIVWTAIAIMLFGYHAELAHIMPALFFTGTATLCVLLVLEREKKNWILLLPFVGFPTFFTIAQSIELNIHGGIYLYSVAVLYFLYRLEKPDNWKSALAFIIISGLIANSDQFLTYILFIPTALAALFHLYLKKEVKYIRLFLVSCACIVFAAISQILIWALLDYDVLGYGGKSIADLEQLATNISVVVEGIAYYFDFTFSRGWVGLSLSAFHLLCFFLIVALFLKSVRTGWHKSFLDTVLLACVVIPMAAFMVSSVAIDLSSSRFLYFSLLCLFLFTARNIVIQPRYFSLLFGFVIIWSASNLHSTLIRGETENSYYKRLTHFLTDNGLSVGYAGFWRASIATAMGPVHVIPVFTDPLLRPRHWLSRDDWYGKRGNFFLIRDEFEATNAVNQFGVPDHQLEFEGMKVFVWEDLQSFATAFRIEKIAENALPMQVYEMTKDGVTSRGEDGLMLSGPYTDLEAGTYHVVLNGVKRKGNAEVEIFSMANGLSIKEPIAEGDGTIADFTFSSKEELRNLELRIHVTEEDDLSISGYSITQVSRAEPPQIN